MALVESEVAFQRRCDELEPGLYAKFKGQDIVSFSTLAFALGSPQNRSMIQNCQSWQQRSMEETPLWEIQQTSEGFILKRALF